MTTRQQKRATERTSAKSESAARVYITAPELFTDCMGEEWTAKDGETGQVVTMDLLDVVLMTVRRCPVQTAEDGERALEIIQTIKSTTNGAIELRRADYDWMMGQMKAHAHKLWSGADSAHLRKVVEAAVSSTPPE